MRLSSTLAAVCVVAFGFAFASSPYVKEQARAIKALSPEEIADYTAGKGMGFAKAAELNGYPGPVHVLELARELELTAEQKDQTEALFRRMQTQASDAGRRLVDEERRLDQLFASRSISAALLHEETAKIASLQGEIRQAHLHAHIEQRAILSDTQSMKYWHLRGYGDASGEAHQKHKH
jgi:Spy/CpxP family protein refolding chaperone